MFHRITNIEKFSKLVKVYVQVGATGVLVPRRVVTALADVSGTATDGGTAGGQMNRRTTASGSTALDSALST